MTSKRSRTTDTGGAHRRQRKPAAGDRAALTGGADDAAWPTASRRPEEGSGSPADAGARLEQDMPPGSAATPAGSLRGWTPGAEPVARRTATGWRVGDEEVSDLTSAMVLADLLAADLPTETMPTVDAAAPGGAAARGGAGAAQGTRMAPGDETVDPERLQVTVAQLEHALTARVRVEQAIGVLAERHRLRPRQAFELLRSAARARGRRVMEIATEVVDSATNPLLRIPEELAKPPVTRRRGRVARHTLENG
jgi:ANTAR domain